MYSECIWIPKDWTTFAGDDCGNFFIDDSVGKIGFLDHETNEIAILATSFTDFCNNTAVPSSVELKPGQVKSIWVNPNFKPKFN